MHYMDSEKWDWNWALKQFAINRSELSSKPARQVGFGSPTRRKTEDDDDED